MIVTLCPVGASVTMIYTHACCPYGAKGQRVTMIYTLGVTMGVNDNQNII